MTDPPRQGFRELSQSYTALSADCRQLDREIAFCRRKVERLASSEGFSDIFLLRESRERLDILTDRSRALCDQRARAAEALYSCVERLPSDLLRAILEYRYLEGLKWQQVSELTGTDLRWVYRLHRRALELLG